MKLLIILVITIGLPACDKMERPFSKPANSANGGPTLRVIQTIPLPGVEGRIDHVAFDLNAIKVTHSISGLSEPQGIVFVPEFRKIFVANGGNGACENFDSDTFQLIDTLDLSGEADNIRYYVRSRLVYVGYGNGGLH